MATPRASAAATVACISRASPACQPQAMLAELTRASSSASSAAPSPRSAFRSTVSCRAVGSVITQRAPELIEPGLPLAQRLARFVQAAGDESQIGPEAHLGQLPQ